MVRPVPAARAGRFSQWTKNGNLQHESLLIVALRCRAVPGELLPGFECGLPVARRRVHSADDWLERRDQRENHARSVGGMREFPETASA